MIHRLLKKYWINSKMILHIMLNVHSFKVIAIYGQKFRFWIMIMCSKSILWKYFKMIKLKQWLDFHLCWKLKMRLNSTQDCNNVKYCKSKQRRNYDFLSMWITYQIIMFHPFQILLKIILKEKSELRKILQLILNRLSMNTNYLWKNS